MSMRKDLDITWNWDEIFIAYCTKDLSFENLSKTYKERHGGDGPATGTIFNRSKEEKWKDRKKKWIEDRQDSQLQEIKKMEVIEFKKSVEMINNIIEKASKDIIAKFNIPKTKVELKTGEVITISRYDAKIKDLDRLLRLKKMMLDGNDQVKNLTLTLNYPTMNMTDEDKKDYEEFVRKELSEKAIDVPFELVDTDEEVHRSSDEGENDGTE